MQLRLATDDEKAARDAVTYDAWGARLSKQQYVERELLLRAHRWSRAVMQTWLWVDAADQVLASCETYRMPGVLGERRGNTWAIASVYTELSLRGHGHATALMNALAAKLSGEPDALASTLYSDVGAAIYARSGYRPYEAFDWVLPPLHEPVAPLPEASSPPHARAAFDGELIITPGADQLDWHAERSRLYARLLQRPDIAVRSAQSDDTRAWYQAYLREGELLVLWLEVSDAASAGPLLRHAQRLAAQAGLSRVRMYDTGLDLSAFAQRSARQGELPMVRTLSPHPIRRWVSIQRALWV